MEFTETLTLEVPRIEEKLAEFAESDFNKKNGLIIEVAAIHEGITANYNNYSAPELEAALSSWTEPYRKPILLHHDPTSEAVGRVIAAKMDHEADGTPYVRLQVAISDPSAIERIKDQRYLTGSVGGRAKEANCSICEADWSNASMFNLPCKHARGKTYQGKVATINMKKISFKEYSFVNMPADARSSVVSTEVGESEDSWVRPARFFSLPLGEESIFELTEGQSINILSGVRKKEALPIYHGLRGAFLSALAENDSEENSMDEDEVEDILAVSEELSADLAKPEEAEETEEATDETEEEVASEESDEETEEDVEDSAEEDSTEEPVEEGDEKPEGQEKSHTSDVDPDTSAGADKSREAEDEATDTAEEEEKTNEDEAEVAKLKEANEALELLVSELRTREESLREENTRLKTALKKGLAERVVDTKIALGMAKTEERDELLDEHIGRSASSLADSLRDLTSMSRTRPDKDTFPTVEPRSAAVPGEADAEIIDVDESTKSKSLDPEEIFVDVFMGRRTI